MVTFVLVHHYPSDTNHQVLSLDLDLKSMASKLEIELPLKSAYLAANAQYVGKEDTIYVRR